NIEAAIVAVYRANPSLVDYEVDGGLGATIVHFGAVRQGKEPPPPPTDENRRLVFEAVREICDWRLGLGDLAPDAEPLLEPKSIDDIAACLKRVRKSVQGWTKRAGRTGYLTFIAKYIP
ncbi:MAG TPA: hypothetical protein VE913_02900, partial [Longimicrobium sp.]|nr:hypothetical protein [Longimicrobium sp.]